MISIIIPVFNRATTLEETLNSILSQSYIKWECILVDDGSTDTSLLLIDSYCENDKRFRVFKRPENRIKGPSTCRNIGIENANGDYVIFLDSDDLLATFCLEQRISAFQEYKDADFLVFDMLIFSDKAPLVLQHELITRKEEDWLSNFIQLRGSWQTTAPIYKINFVKKIDGFSDQIMIFEDFEIAIKALLNSSNYFVFKNIDYYYRNDDDYFKKHIDLAYEKKVVNAFVSFLSIVHDNIVASSNSNLRKKLKNNINLAYVAIFNRYIIKNVEVFKNSNGKMITFLYKNNYISIFKLVKYLFVQHFLFKFYKIKGFGLYRFMSYLIK
ncbi:glycosyltransferase family 2 protein [Flavobacterium sp. N2820]|uniref:glycosyltransferase family 2 protein n=1 Tax=Flavobacterium sp. N2820 TaxID=2986834 RepID=UPI0022244C76|nr:glycosyltransferase family 2 protein [Flavobacterium sp. N2820]